MDVALPQLVAEVAKLHSRVSRDEVFVTGMHDAVDHNAILLGAVLDRPVAVEGKLCTAEAVVTKLGVDAKENDDLLDA